MSSDFTRSLDLWNAARRGGAKGVSAHPEDGITSDQRMPFEHDFDRLLFSTPVRRLADKTQVFPLDRNDSVRTRLTHSHEVSNLARSIGNRLARTKPGIFGGEEADRAAPIILAGVGLAHDLGNPPFGHKGRSQYAVGLKLTAIFSNLMALRKSPQNYNMTSFSLKGMRKRFG